MSYNNTYEDYLNVFIDRVFTKAAKDWTWTEFARHAGVAYSTVYNLGTYKTKRPQLRTAFLLSKAVGIELPAIHTKHRLKIAS